MGAAGSSEAAISKQVFNLKLTSKQLSKVFALFLIPRWFFVSLSFFCRLVLF